MEKNFQRIMNRQFCVTVFCLNASETDYESILNLFKATKDPAKRELYLRSMGCIENEEILTRFINTIIEKNILDNGNDEWDLVIRVVYSNGPVGMRVAMRFLRYKYMKFLSL